MILGEDKVERLKRPGHDEDARRQGATRDGREAGQEGISLSAWWRKVAGAHEGFIPDNAFQVSYNRRVE